ncbi:hemolysin XhlA family protein [Cytobacillus sp. FSL K6-0129]|uniref:hemolysin XhlA family protein n=1 Tax=Cytobacillus sp. FSL K6-0129 TaxID=2921421 RepID=UPI0030F6AB78
MNTHDKEITELKGDIKSLENRVNILERKSDLHGEKIDAIDKKLEKIEDNTTWIKRALIGAIITAISTGLIGGAIALFYNVIGG